MTTETSPVDQELHHEGEAGLSDRLKFRPIPQAGPFVHGNYIPLYGMEMRIIQIQGNKNLDFFVVLAPQAVTKGHMKRMYGKKGKKGAKGTGKGKRS